VGRVLTAKTTELLELQAIRRFLFIFCRHVIAIFAIATLQNNIISHNFSGVRCQLGSISGPWLLKPET
jgi:hypothetical protein